MYRFIQVLAQIKNWRETVSPIWLRLLLVGSSRILCPDKEDSPSKQLIGSAAERAGPTGRLHLMRYGGKEGESCQIDSVVHVRYSLKMSKFHPFISFYLTHLWILNSYESMENNGEII